MAPDLSSVIAGVAVASVTEMSERYLADELDRAILRLLQLDGRRPFSEIAAVLGVADQTVARRYTLLRSRAGVQVIGVRRTRFRYQEFWVLRIRAAGDVNTLATNLARRSDVRWVHSVSGPSSIEIVGMASCSPGEQEGFPLLEQLAALPSVESATAQMCLKMFFGGPDSLLTKSEDPALAASPPENVDDLYRDDLSREDHRLLTALEVNGRASVKDLARVSGLTADTVTRRLTTMQTHGTVYFDVDFDPRLLGLQCSTGVWASVAPAELESAGRCLTSHPEISFAAAVTGDANLYAVAHAADADAMYRYSTGPLAELPGLQRVQSAPHLRIFKTARRNAVP